MSPKQKFQLALGVIVVLVATGTLGYKFFLPEQTWFDCFYFTLITITTIGYGEPKDMTEPARYFTAFLILTGVSSIGYALSAAAQALVEFELVAQFGRRRMYKDISKLTNHFIVCGSGRIGSGVIREIARRSHDFVVIEGDESVADKLLAQGYLVLMGDATNDDVLRAAGIERARGIVCAVSSDPDNLYITLAARDLNKTIRIVARANDESGINRLLKAGADKVVSPTITGSNQMAQVLLRPAVADFMEMATMTEQLELEMEQIEIYQGSPFIHRALKDTGIRSTLDVIIIAIRRHSGTMIFNPAADTIIELHDALVAIGSHDNLLGLERMANPDSTKDAVFQHRH
ncbi:MAG: voltage-gated potassium channel [Blastocatellia bacterium]